MTSQIKKILYATDLSKNSSYAFLYAAVMARKYEARIIVVHTVEPFPSYIAFFARKETARIDEKEQMETIHQIQKLLGNFCKKAESHIGPPCVSLVSSILVRMGHPADEILKVADEEDCDTIVLGTHGKGFLKQAFLGSTSRQVLEHTRKPVFIIPLPPEEIGIDWD